MTTRDSNGRFTKGHSGNPNGRPAKAREERYYEIMIGTCTYKDWEAIIRKAVSQAKRGNYQARKWLSDYLIGPPVQRRELTGADGRDLIINLAWGDNAGDDDGDAAEAA